MAMPVLRMMLRSPVGVMLFVVVMSAVFHLHEGRLIRIRESKRTEKTAYG